MTQVLVNGEFRRKLESSLKPVDLVDEAGILLGRYVPNPKRVEEISKIIDSFPPITDEERKQAREEIDRGECFTTQQMIDFARQDFQKWKDGRP